MPFLSMLYIPSKSIDTTYSDYTCTHLTRIHHCLSKSRNYYLTLTQTEHSLPSQIRHPQSLMCTFDCQFLLLAIITKYRDIITLCNYYSRQICSYHCHIFNLTMSRGVDDQCLNTQTARSTKGHLAMTRGNNLLRQHANNTNGS